MGLIDKLQDSGIDETEMYIAVNQEHNMLEFSLNSPAVQENYEGKYIHGPVNPTEDPGTANTIYLGLLKDLVLEEYVDLLKISEQDAEKVIEKAQEKIKECEAAGIIVSNKKEFYVPE